MGGLNKPSVRQTQRSLSDRVGGLEQNLARVLFGINQRFQASDQRLTTLEDLVEALVNLQGAQDVHAFVNEKRVERAREASAKEQASLEEGISDGFVLKAASVGDKSIIVGKYTDVEGKVIEPGRAQLVIPGVQPQFKELLIGKTPGAILDLPNGEKFELTEIYEVDEEKAREVIKARAEKATAAATAAAGEAAAADEEEATPVDEEPAVEAE